jgi:DNA replicative helicase MCM subunit Mcm2 (Cdc46/Mcm family)
MELVNAYVEMRSMGDDPRASEKCITATRRRLESLIQLSEAHVRMRFSEFVELADVKEASPLMRKAIRTSTMDPRTNLGRLLKAWRMKVLLRSLVRGRGGLLGGLRDSIVESGET